MSQSLTNLTRALAAVVMLLSSAAPAAAQTGASTGLSGRVTDGSGARNSVTGPGQQRIDINVSKLTKITSRSSLELRLEVYNLFNTTSFRNPQNDLGSSDFGVITATRGGPRLVQLGAKVRF